MQCIGAVKDFEVTLHIHKSITEVAGKENFGLFFYEMQLQIIGVVLKSSK